MDGVAVFEQCARADDADDDARDLHGAETLEVVRSRHGDDVRARHGDDDPGAVVEQRLAQAQHRLAQKQVLALERDVVHPVCGQDDRQDCDVDDSERSHVDEHRPF